MSELKRAAALALLLITPGCSMFQDCTLIGCVGLVVQVTNVPSGTAITVVVTAPDQSTRSATMTCVGGGGCPFSFPDFTPQSMTVKVTAGSQSREVTVQPNYQVTRPNGSHCPPECRTAQVPVAF